jgi:hypothetical protein
MRGDSPGHRGFRRNVELIRPKEYRADLLEEALFDAATGQGDRKINVRALIAALKRYAKHRGYGGPRTVDEFGTPLAHPEDPKKADDSLRVPLVSDK